MKQILSVEQLVGYHRARSAADLSFEEWVKMNKGSPDEAVQQDWECSTSSRSNAAVLCSDSGC
jgi:hypothetical protein